MSRHRVPCCPARNPGSRSSIRRNRSMWQVWRSNREARFPLRECPRMRRAMSTSRWRCSGAADVTATLRERLLESGSIETKLDALEAVTPRDVAATRAASGRRFCVGRVRSSATDDEHCRGDRLHRAKRETIHRAVQGASRHHAEGLLSHPSIPARSHDGDSGPSGRVDAGGARLRLLRSGALHSRFPIVRGPDPKRVSVGPNLVSEPRQISTIRRRRHLTR